MTPKTIALAVTLAAAGFAGWAGTRWAGAEAEPRHAVVHKSPSCGCCGGWIAYLEQHGWQVTVKDTDAMDEVKARLGVPAEAHSCHTAEIAGYVVEGHVPVEAIDKLLAERPKVTGIASPGMPQGSPGMSGPKEPNVVVTFGGGPASVVGTY